MARGWDVRALVPWQAPKMYMSDGSHETLPGEMASLEVALQETQGIPATTPGPTGNRLSLVLLLQTPHCSSTSPPPCLQGWLLHSGCLPRAGPHPVRARAHSQYKLQRQAGLG